jgi:hypothetical protein
MIDILRVGPEQDGWGLFIDGVPSGRVLGTKRGLSSVHLSDPASVESLISHRFRDFPASSVSWTIRIQPNVLDCPVELCVQRKGKRAVEASLHIRLDDGWKRPYPFAQFKEEFSRILSTRADPGIEVHKLDMASLESLLNELGIAAPGAPQYRDIEPLDLPHIIFVDWKPAPPLASVVRDELSPRLKILRDVSEQAHQSLIIGSRPDSMSVSFEFPEPVKVACEPYLLYFVEFLKQLGIESSADITHDAGHILFAVTPKHSRVALEKLYQALEVYLSLPSSPIGGPDDDPVVLGLRAQIYHFQGQLKMAQAIIQLQQTTIDAQKLAITQQQRAFGTELLLESIRPVTPTPHQDREEVIPGFISVKDHSISGVVIHLPKLFRSLKEFLFGPDPPGPKERR